MSMKSHTKSEKGTRIGVPLFLFVQGFFRGVAGLPLRLFLIFNRLFRATANARHTVGAIRAPNGLAVLQFDVVKRAVFDAQPATDASVCRIKPFCRNKQLVKNRIDRTAVKAVERADFLGWKVFARTHGFRGC